MNKIVLAVLLLLVVVSLNGLNHIVLAYAPQSIDNVGVTIDTKVLVIFAGIDNETLSQLNLNTTYTFTLTNTTRLKISLYTRVLSREAYNNVTRFIDENSKHMSLTGFMRNYLRVYHPEWNISTGCYVRADFMEEYLYTITDELYNGYDYVLFLLYYPQDHCLRTYYIEKYFWETRSTRNYTGLVAFGGNTPLFFIDLSSIPRTHPDKTQPLYGYGEPVDINTFKPLWDIGSSKEKALLLEKYILDYMGFLVLRKLFNDRLPWSPRYVVDIHVIDYTSGTGYDRVMKILNTSILSSYLHALAPYTTWKIKTSRVEANNSSLLMMLLENSTRRIEDNKTWIILDYVNTVLLITGHYQIISVGENETIIPVYIFVANTPLHFEFNHQLNFTGAAVPRVGIIVSYPGYYYRVLEEGMGMVIAHEVGHLLGLTHPFEGYDPLTGNETMIWLYDYIASPMSYAPTLAGWLGGIFVYDAKSLCRYHVLDLASMLSSNTEYRDVVRNALEKLSKDECLGDKGALKLLVQAYLGRRIVNNTVTSITVVLTRTQTISFIETETMITTLTETHTSTIENTVTTTRTVTTTHTLLEEKTVTTTTTITVTVEKTPSLTIYLLEALVVLSIIAVAAAIVLAARRSR